MNSKYNRKNSKMNLKRLCNSGNKAAAVYLINNNTKNNDLLNAWVVTAHNEILLHKREIARLWKLQIAAIEGEDLRKEFELMGGRVMSLSEHTVKEIKKYIGTITDCAAKINVPLMVLNRAIIEFDVLETQLTASNKLVSELQEKIKYVEESFAYEKFHDTAQISELQAEVARIKKHALELIDFELHTEFEDRIKPEVISNGKV
jgi:hypothetical protein